MRRDFNGEILVALFAVGVLALALVFGIVLTISRNVATPSPSTGTATLETAIAVNGSPTQTSDTTPRNVDIPTVAPASETPITPTATNTKMPTEAVTATAAEAVTAEVTTLSPSATAKGTVEVANAPTETVRPSATPTLTATDRPTVTPSVTASTTPSRTPSLTLTVTSSKTPLPTKTITPQPTYTPIPSLTPQPTFTPQATYTPYPTLTQRATLTPSRTRTATSIPSPTLSLPTMRPVTSAPVTLAPTQNAGNNNSGGSVPTVSAVCSQPNGWVAYIVQRGDTLFNIARQAGITVGELQRGNCLDSDRIYVGQVLAVPQGRPIGNPTVTGIAPVPGSTTAPGGNGTSDVLPGENIVQCGDASVQITSPRPGITVSGTISLYGSAVIPNFSFYKVEIRNEANSNWSTLFSSQTPIQNGPLGQINTALFPAGIYWIQVLAIDNTSNYPVLPCAIRLNFAN